MHGGLWRLGVLSVVLLVGTGGCAVGPGSTHTSQPTGSGRSTSAYIDVRSVPSGATLYAVDPEAEQYEVLGTTPTGPVYVGEIPVSAFDQRGWTADRIFVVIRETPRGLEYENVGFMGRLQLDLSQAPRGAGSWTWTFTVSNLHLYEGEHDVRAIFFMEAFGAAVMECGF